MKLPYYGLSIRHWNPGASIPLVFNDVLLCNTPDEQIYDNIRVNSRKIKKWQKVIPAHDGVAILCGSGPSLADTLSEIALLRADGGKVFALNGAADYLNENGMLPDYQVILDARPDTAVLVGPAKEHLFASQCSPETFAAAPNATLWHLQVENFEDLLPENEADEDDDAVIGGAASVGNTAICLAYAMGYRRMEVFGYDSCHKGEESHPFHQPLNDGEPCVIVSYGGKKYRASLTMRMQAEKFQDTAKELQRLGCTVNVHGYGLLPDIWNAPDIKVTEREKYEAMWSIPQYRIVSPGEETAVRFIDIVDPLPGGTIVDFGCGTGRGGLAISNLSGNPVLLVDFAANCLDEAARELPFFEADLSGDLRVVGDYGYCSDVMEHIPPAQVDHVIRNIMSCVPQCFFRIDFDDDICGEYIGERLHLSVHPHDWWMATFDRLGYEIRWWDEGKEHGLFHVFNRGVKR